MTADEAIRHGCDVYPHVVEKAQPLDVSAFDVPSAARWISADRDGSVYPYSERPSMDESDAMWKYSSSHEMFDALVFCLGTINMTGIDWRRTLTAVNVGLHAQPSPAAETIVVLWQQLDAMQECDLAAAMVRASEHAAEGFHMALGMALEAVRSPRYVGEDKERHARIWDSIEAQLRVAQ